MLRRGRKSQRDFTASTREQSVDPTSGAIFKDAADVRTAIAANVVVKPRLKRDFTGDGITLPASSSELIKANRSNLWGVDAIAVAAKALEGLAFARAAKDPVGIVQVLVLAVILGQGIASNCHLHYATLPSDNFMSFFDISGRDPQPGATWVQGSKMNASAFRILGHMVLHAGASTPQATALIEKRGTIFQPLEGEGEFQKLCREYGASDEEMAACSAFAGEFKALANAVCSALGTASGDVEVVRSIAAATLSGAVKW